MCSVLPPAIFPRASRKEREPVESGKGATTAGPPTLVFSMGADFSPPAGAALCSWQVRRALVTFRTTRGFKICRQRAGLGRPETLCRCERLQDMLGIAADRRQERLGGPRRLAPALFPVA